MISEQGLDGFMTYAAFVTVTVDAAWDATGSAVPVHIEVSTENSLDSVSLLLF